MISINTPIDIDQEIVIAPLEELTAGVSFKEIKSRIFDVQPVRDIFLLSEAWLKSKVGFQVYTFTNWLIVVLMTFLLIKALILLNVNRTLALMASITFLFHPVLSWIVYWPSAQKHLLSCLFIGLGTYFSIKKFKESSNIYNFRIWLLYFLSIFSQPITVFAIIPYFFIFKKNQYQNKEFILSSLLMISFTLCLSLNMYYYSTLYPIQADVLKIANFSFKINFANSILSISRSFSQIFFPISFAINYVKISTLSFVGLPLFILCLAWIYKKLKKKLTVFFILLTLFPFLTVYSRITNIFISDSYLIWPLISIIAFLTYSLKKSNLKAMIFIGVLPLTLALKAHFESKITSNKDQYFHLSYKREPTCKNVAQYLSYSMNLPTLNTNRYNQAAEDFLKNECHISGGGVNLNITNFISLYFLLTDKITLNDKIKNIESFQTRTITSDTILLILYERNGDKFRADKLKKFLKKYSNLDKVNQYKSKLMESINISPEKKL